MKNWRKALIRPDTTILDALKMIDTAALQIALVVDKDGKLLGTVTDGDIRRSILQNVSFASTVDTIMNSNYKYAPLTATKNELMRMMTFYGLRHIPLLDGQRKIQDLAILNHLLDNNYKENWAVIMAGGLGTRLRPLTEKCPKPMLTVGGRPLLESIIENFYEYGFRKFYFAVNYKADLIENYFQDGSHLGVRIEYLHEPRRLGTAGALSLLPEKPAKSIIVMNGDIFTKINFEHLLDFHRDSGAMATMCVKDYHYQVPYGVVRVRDKKIFEINEKPVSNFFVNAGIYVLQPEVLSYIPKDTDYNMPSLFEKLLRENIQPVAFPIREYWLDIGKIEDYQKANTEQMPTQDV